MQGKQWQVKPPRENISCLHNTPQLSQKQTQPVWSSLSRELPHYRLIRQDGNSFYRSIAFNYLRDCNISSFDETFPDISRIELDICKNIPSELAKYYKDGFMRASMRAGWEALFKQQSAKAKEDRLVTAFNRYQWLDFLVVNYFRCKVNKTLVMNQEFYRTKVGSKTNAGLMAEMSKVLSYGHEAEGVEVYALVNSLDTEIDIYQVTKKGVTRQKYRSETATKKQSIFVKEGHYNILYSSQKGDRPSLKQRVHFKLDLDTSLNTSLNKSSQSISAQQLAKTPSVRATPKPLSSKAALMKKNSWGSTYTDQSVSIEINSDFWNSIDFKKVAILLLCIVVVSMGIACVFKAHFYGASSLETRSQWEWREEYVAFESHKIQNHK